MNMEKRTEAIVEAMVRAGVIVLGLGLAAIALLGEFALVQWELGIGFPIQVSESYPYFVAAFWSTFGSVLLLVLNCCVLAFVVIAAYLVWVGITNAK